MRLVRERMAVLLTLALVLCGGVTAAAQTQQSSGPDTTAFYRALDLEGAAKYREAAPLFREAMRLPATAVNALLGLERVYAELGWSDSLLAPLDTLIAAHPDESVYRSIQLRTLQTLGRSDDLRQAFEQWAQSSPQDATPYREFARILLQRNQPAAADSVLRRAGQALGSTGDLQLEIAQARAAQGLWAESARAWRLALMQSPYLEQAAVYALAATPSAIRPGVREILLAAPIDVGARRVLAGLEVGWGSPADGWAALKDLPVDSASADAWQEFGERAESQERWSLAREAFVAALAYRPTPELSVRAARAALNSGDTRAVMTLAPLSQAGTDSATLAQVYVPLHARALALMGRPSEAARLVARVDRWLTPGTRNELTRTVAWGWVRSGDMRQARAVLESAGPAGDSSDAAGWLALYNGDLKTARVLLRTGTENTPELALALGLIARVHADTAPALGKPFLALARGDSVAAAVQFAAAAKDFPEAASLLLLTAAQLHSARHEDEQALALWKQIVEQQGSTPEAPQAELEWARALRAADDTAGATARLEHLILTYPQSALVPQARRELDLTRKSIPGRN